MFKEFIDNGWSWVDFYRHLLSTNDPSIWWMLWTLRIKLKTPSNRSHMFQMHRIMSTIDTVLWSTLKTTKRPARFMGTKHSHGGSPIWIIARAVLATS
jgi:hypothetical protein